MSHQHDLALPTPPTGGEEASGSGGQPARPARGLRRRSWLIPIVAVVALLLGFGGGMTARQAEVDELNAGLVAAQARVTELESEVRLTADSDEEAVEVAESEPEPEPEPEREPERDVVSMPDVVGMTLRDARVALREAGVRGRLVQEERETDDAPAGEVMETVPPAGEKIGSKDEVTVYVATEPAVVFLSQSEVATFADWEYRVTEVQTHASLRDSTPRGTYVAVLVQFTNNASVPRSVDSMFALVASDSGRQYDMDSSASLAHHHTFEVDTWHLEEIGPGFSAVVPIVFDVPDPTAGPWLFAFGSGDDIGPVIELDPIQG